MCYLVLVAGGSTRCRRLGIVAVVTQAAAAAETVVVAEAVAAVVLIVVAVLVLVLVLVLEAAHRSLGIDHVMFRLHSLLSW